MGIVFKWIKFLRMNFCFVYDVVVLGKTNDGLRTWIVQRITTVFQKDEKENKNELF